jgi:hypothetical protein
MALLGFESIELEPVVFVVHEACFGESGLAASDGGFGEKGFVELGTGFDENKLAALEVVLVPKRVVVGADGDVAVFVGEGGIGKLANGLKRGTSSLEASGKGITFFGLGFAGLSSIFLNMLEVLDPVGVSLDLGVFIRLPSRSSLSSSSFVN